MRAHDVRSDVRDARGHENNKMRAQVRSDVQIKRLVSFHKIEFYVTMFVILNTYYRPNTARRNQQPFVQPTRDSTPNPVMTSATLSCRPFSSDIVSIATTCADMSETFPTKPITNNSIKQSTHLCYCCQSYCQQNHTSEYGPQFPHSFHAFFPSTHLRMHALT